MEEGSGRILSAHFAWTASQLANISVLAIRAGLPTEALKETVFAYPTQISSLLWML